MTLAIACTRGTWPGQILYAKDIHNRSDARRMVETAVHYGYRDAHIVDQQQWTERRDAMRKLRDGERRDQDEAARGAAA